MYVPLVAEVVGCEVNDVDSRIQDGESTLVEREGTRTGS